MTGEEFIRYCQEQGYTVQAIKDALCDGSVLAKYGIPLEEAEDTYNRL